MLTKVFLGSLRRRLLLVGGLLLLLFVAMTGATLNSALSKYAHQAEYQRLQGLVFSLLAVIEVNPSGDVSISEGGIPETRLSEPDSGLDVFVLAADNSVVWQSLSVTEPLVEPPAIPDVGEWNFSDGDKPVITFGFEWEEPGLPAFQYSLVIKDSASPILLQRQSFTQRLWWGLLIAAFALLMILLSLFHWGLLPLRKVVDQLHDIRSGDASELRKDVPEEIKPLTRSINKLLKQERERQQRYRHAMEDLAHSLKTPLAVLKGGSEGDAEDQLMRMDQIISYQLQRASASGGALLHKKLALRPEIDRTAGALAKVYRDKEIQFEIDVSVDEAFPIEQGDFLEIVGNIMDNAAKYGAGKVKVSASRMEGVLQLSIEDNGEGFPEGVDDSMLERGVRADTRAQGQGIGLSVVNDLVAVYGGSIALEESCMGGAKVTINFRSE